jgi:hypothetical protein
MRLHGPFWQITFLVALSLLYFGGKAEKLINIKLYLCLFNYPGMAY